MPEAQSSWFYIVHQLQVAGKLSTKVAGNHLLLSVTGGSERCRSGSEISGARLYERRGAERRSGGVEGCGIRDELIIACSNSRPSSSQFPRVSPLRSIIPTGFSKLRRQCRSGRGAGLQKPVLVGSNPTATSIFLRMPPSPLRP